MDPQRLPSASRTFNSVFSCRSPRKADVLVHQTGQRRVFFLPVIDPDLHFVVFFESEIVNPVIQTVPQHQIVPAQPDQLQTQFATTELAEQTDELVCRGRCFKRTHSDSKIPSSMG